MIPVNLTLKEAEFLAALLGCGTNNRQTALQLLAAEHLYEPTLLPKLKKAIKDIKKSQLAD